MKYRLVMLAFLLFFPRILLAEVPSTKVSTAAPKLANMFLATKMTQSDVVSLAKWDLLILPMDFQVLYPGELRELRRRNPDIILLAYVASQETFYDFSGLKQLFPMRYRLFQGIDPRWYVTAPDGAKKSFWPGTTLLNVTPECPRVGGKTWTEYLADFMTREVLSTGLWNGIFYDNAWDNISYFAPGPLDLDHDGAEDRAPDVRWHAGMVSLFAQTRALAKNPIVLVGNNDTPAYTKELNGMLLENYDKKRFAELFAKAGANARLRLPPRVNIMNSNSGNTGNQMNYPAMRLGFTSALLSDHYFSFDFGDKNHGQLWWYDEYDIDLGVPVGEAAPVGAEDSVWQREFARGRAIVNGGEKSVHVPLLSEYEKITGVQDRAVNSGAIVEEVTVGPTDGVVLLKPLKTLEELVYPNGWFARFVNGKGERVRNGFFTFDSSIPPGVTTIRTDMNGDGERDIVIANGARLTVLNHEGKRIAEVFPYTANFKAELRFAVFDAEDDGKKEIVIVPGAGVVAPLKIYSLYGDVLATDVFPFGPKWSGGMTVGAGDVSDGSGPEIVVGSGGGRAGTVGIYSAAATRLREWVPFGPQTTGGLAVAVGNVVPGGASEIVVGGLNASKATLGIFSALGVRVLPDSTPITKRPSTLLIDTADVNFDGVDDIILLTRDTGV